MGVLRQVFGPNVREVWQKLCHEIGASFIEGGAWDGDRVQATHGQWSITLDLFHVHSGRVPLVFTRLRAPYVNPDQFYFSVTKRGLFSGLAKMLGMQDIEVGYAQFDRDFIIKGNDDQKLKALFASHSLRELLTAQPDVHFSIETSDDWPEPAFPPQTDSLCFIADGLISDVDRLKSLFDLFAVTLDQLCLIGSAYEGTLPAKNS